LLAVRVDKVDLVMAPSWIRNTQIVDFVANDAESVRKLARAVIHTPEAGPLPDPLPPVPDVPESYRDRFKALYGPELAMVDQVHLCALLKEDADKGVNADEARQLLRVLHDRHDVAWKVREDVGRYLADTPGQPTNMVTNGAPDPLAKPRPLPVPGWYVDPTRKFELRYWDGQRWTEHAVRGGTVYRDLLPGS
jgi:hypothetical protein